MIDEGFGQQHVLGTLAPDRVPAVMSVSRSENPSWRLLRDGRHEYARCPERRQSRAAERAEAGAASRERPCRSG
jgi:hypothetical protein